MRESRLFVVAVLVLALGSAFWLTRDDRSVAADDRDRQQRLGELLPSVGRPAPALVARTASGETIDLRELRGRPVWVTFGASWCPPCRAEAPDIEALIADHADDRLAVVAIYLGEDADSVAGFVERLGLTYASVPDPHRALGALFGVRGLPSHYFIAPDGTLTSMRISSLSREQMEAEVAALLVG